MEHATGVGARICASRHNIESGDSKEPRFSTGLRIAAALGINPSELVSPAPDSQAPAPTLAITVRTIRRHRADLAHFGIAHVSIFGSVARGDATASSDVDVIIEPAPNRRFTLFDIARAQQKLENIVGSRVDVVTLKTLQQYRTGRAAEEEAVHVF